MTFKQLIDKYRFEDIVTELLEIWDKGNLYRFRQAMDILRRLSPAGEEDGEVITVSRVESETGTYYRVSNLSGWYWDNNLNWDIVLSPDCELSEKQLLALCLWERTFYGFSPQQEKDTFDEWNKESECGVSMPDNEFSRQLRQLKRRHYKKYVKRRFRIYDKFGMPVWPDEYEVSEKQRRRSFRKLKAERRYEERCEYLESMSERLELIKDVCTKYPTLNEDDVKFILNEKDVKLLGFSGMSSSVEEASDYISISIREYSDLPEINDASHCIVLVRLPEGCELKPESKVKLMSAIESKAGVVPSQFHVRDSKDDGEITLTIIYCD